MLNELYNSILINKFISCFQKKGKKELVENKFYKALLNLKKKNLNGILLLFYAIEIVRPTMLAIRSVKRGTVLYVGTSLTLKQQYFTSIRWIVNSIVSQKGTNLINKIINELLSIVFLFKGGALKKKKENYLIIFKNRALTHYRWK